MPTLPGDPLKPNEAVPPGAIVAFQPALVITYCVPVWLTIEASQMTVIVLSQLNDKVQLLMARRAVIRQRDLAAEARCPSRWSLQKKPWPPTKLAVRSCRRSCPFPRSSPGSRRRRQRG